MWKNQAERGIKSTNFHLHFLFSSSTNRHLACICYVRPKPALKRTANHKERRVALPTTKEHAFHPPLLDLSTGFPLRSTVPSWAKSSQAVSKLPTAMFGFLSY